jgi:serine O-acetyltransferase
VDIIETDATIEANFYYRLERALYLREAQHPALRYFANLMRTKTSIEVYYSADIGPRFNITHGVGLVIGPCHVIGSDFVAYGDVTLGQRKPRVPRETIKIGNHCMVCTGAKVLGDLTIGDNVRVGAGAILLSDAESNSTYAGVPARKVASIPPREN